MVAKKDGRNEEGVKYGQTNAFIAGGTEGTFVARTEHDDTRTQNNSPTEPKRERESIMC